MQQHHNPVDTLKRPYQAPSLGSPYNAGNSASKKPRVGYQQQQQQYGGGSGSGGGAVFRDDETTGYEDDGSEFTQWINLPKPKPHQQQQPTSTFSKLVPGTAGRAGLTPLHSNNYNTASAARNPETRYYEVCWRKPQARKNKSWEHDGCLILTGDRGVVWDKEGGKNIGSGSLAKFGQPYESMEFSWAGKEFQIQREMDPKEYSSGSFFSNMVMTGSPAATATAKQPLAASASFTASASSFYGPARSKAPAKFVPPASRTAYAKTSVGLPPPRAAMHRVNEDSENWSNDVIRHVSPAKPYQSHTISKKTIEATAGNGTAPPQPEAFYDPSTPGAIVMRRPDDEYNGLHNPKNLPVVDVVVMPELGAKLREHQVAGVKFMYECVMGMRTEGEGCILADDMGLGKTIQSITLIHTLLRQSPYFERRRGFNTVIQRALIVCPVTLVNNWDKEFHKWLGRDRIKTYKATGTGKDIRSKVGASSFYNVIIIGYEKLRSVVDELKALQPPIGLIICDEGHRLKSAGAKTSLALRELKTAKRIILSGTPIQNELSEFHSMVDFVNPGLLDAYQTFKRTFEQPILRSREPRCKEDEKELGEARNEALGRITRTFVLRRTADVIAGYLPPKAEYVVFVAPTQLQIKIYNQVLGSSDLKNVFNSGASSLGLITLLKKVCNTPGLLLRDAQAGKGMIDGSKLMNDVLQLFPDGIQPSNEALSGKMLAVATLLQELKEETDEKIVLVSNFTSTLDILEQMCQKHRYRYCRLDGKTKQALRQDIVDTFNNAEQDKQFVFLLSSKSGGTGLNIVGASRLVLFDSDWNPSNDLQAMARIHRDGQKKPCVIYRILTTGTMDEKIFQRQIMKTGLAGSLMDTNNSGGSSKQDAFNLSDLRDIFKLHLDTPCQTHDLLECQCNPSMLPTLDAPGEDAGDSSSDDEAEEDLPEANARSFVTASQLPAKKPTRAIKKLQALKDWTHINCSVDDDTILDNVEDEVLRQAVTAGFERMRLAARADQLAELEREEEDEEALAEIARGPKLSFQGGEVSYVFHKTVAPLLAA